MSNFKEASKQKLRIQTSRGSLSTEQLWDLSLTELDELAVSLEAEHKTSAKKSFLDKTTQKDKTAKLKFDIVLEILTTKVEENEASREAMEIKKHNEKIDALIIAKQDDNLSKLSVKDLEKLRK